MNPYISCKDYTVSNEIFELRYNSSLDMLITYPKPKLSDLGKYYESEDYISHTDAKKTLVDKVYHSVKKYTISKKVKLVNSFLKEIDKEKTILDIGCGTGDFLNACQINGWNIVGVEPSNQAKSLAQEKVGRDIFSIIEDIPSQKFDCITMWHVLEHVPNVDDYISTLKKLLKPKGTLIVAVPNFKSYDALYYKSFWAAYDVPRHLSHFSQKSISLLFDKVNMKVEKTLPMIFDAFYVSLLSEKYKSKKNKYFSAFYIGLKSNLKAAKTSEYSSLIYVLRHK